VAHDTIATGTYALVRGGAGVAARGAGIAVAAARGDTGRPLGSTPRGGLAQAALGGIMGDALVGNERPLAVEMAFRHRGEDVHPDRVAEVMGAPTGRLAIFVHGLCEDENAWSLFRDANGGETYGSRLGSELGYTPLWLRFNTGLHISDNGRRLSDLLAELVAVWPVPVQEITLVGHSLGGLVSRSACHQGEAAQEPWAGAVRHVFHLGTPHLGAPLEQAVNAAGWAMNKVGETRPIARFLELRSVGIKDLRYGAIVDEDWRDADPDCLLDDRCSDVPLLASANHYVISGQLAGPLGEIVGDLLVRQASAAGQGPARRIPFEVDNVGHLPGLNHFQLLNHPNVYERMRAWLGPKALPAPARALPAPA
jgi:pimeloyl-ACP methyl ester carboxylesterase